MLMMRPNRRSIIPSITWRNSSIGVSILLFNADCQSSNFQPRKSPTGGPPALLTRISRSGVSARAMLRPASVVMSHAIALTLPPAISRISATAVSRVLESRPFSHTLTPSAASAFAQPLPRPLLDAQIRAFLPLSPSSIASFLLNLSDFEIKE